MCTIFFFSLLCFLDSSTKEFAFLSMLSTWTQIFQLARSSSCQLSQPDLLLRRQAIGICIEKLRGGSCFGRSPSGPLFSASKDLEG